MDSSCWYEVLGSECDLDPDSPLSIARKPISRIDWGYAAQETATRRLVYFPQGWYVPMRVPMSHEYNIPARGDFHAVVASAILELYRLRKIYESSFDTDENKRTRILHLEICVIALLKNICLAGSVPAARSYEMDFMAGLYCNFVDDNKDAFKYVVQLRDRPDVQQYARKINVE